jgi:hypothetical protein
MAEIMGKATGCAGGVGGSMHMCDKSIGLLPTSAIIGGGMPIATGAALAFQIQKKSHVAVAFFGDAATNIGAFHESLNLAAIWKLPVIFVIDNNVYGEYSRINLTALLAGCRPGRLEQFEEVLTVSEATRNEFEACEAARLDYERRSREFFATRNRLYDHAFSRFTDREEVRLKAAS